MENRVYKLEYLPLARQDMTEIVRYISRELGNPAAAVQLADKLIEAGEELARFPYSCPVYTPLRPLRHEYRKQVVEHYLMFYWTDEARKTVTIARVIYGKRDCQAILK